MPEHPLPDFNQPEQGQKLEQKGNNKKPVIKLPVEVLDLAPVSYHAFDKKIKYDRYQ